MSEQDSQVIEELKNETQALKQSAQEARAAAEAAKEAAQEAKAGARAEAASAMERAAKAEGAVEELRAQLKEQRQAHEDLKAAHMNVHRTQGLGSPNKPNAQTLGRAFVGSEEFQARHKSGDTGQVTLQVGLRALTTSDIYSDPQMVTVQEEDPKRRPVLADYLPVEPLNSTAGVEYVRETSDWLLETKLLAQANSGQAALAVESIAGFSPGQVITISAGLSGQTKGTIDSISQSDGESPAGTITLTANLAANHAAGVRITHTTFAPTPEGEYKPGTKFTEQLKTAPCYTLATGITVSTRALKTDAGRIERKINRKMPRNIDLAEEDQILNGTGANSEVTGILADADVQDFAWSAGDAGDNKSDALARGANKVRDANYEPNLVLMHHDDILDLQLTKDNEGRYLFQMADENGGVVNLPVIMCKALPSGKAVVGDFVAACTLFRDGEVELRAFDSHKDYAEKNLSYIRAERDISFTIEHPYALCVISFDSAPV